MSAPKISVVVITYNQEDLISRALESILQQKEYVYEIIVADDCSQDGTWNRILKYVEMYPDLVKGYRNPKNLGIVGNIQFTWTKITGNLVYCCSGDDELCDGLFDNALKRMEHENVDYDNDAFTIYCDFEEVTPDGKHILFKQDMVEYHDTFDLKIRNLISNRSLGSSKKIMNQLRPVDGNLGINEDGLLDAQIQFLSRKSYYFNYIGSRYYSRIGVSSKTSRLDLISSEISTLTRSLVFFGLKGRNASWIMYDIAYLTFVIEKSPKDYFIFLRHFFVNIDIRYGKNFIIRELRKFIRATKYFIHNALNKS